MFPEQPRRTPNSADRTVPAHDRGVHARPINLRARLMAAAAAVLFVAACAKKETPPSDSTAAAMPAMSAPVTVSITSPSEGDTIHGSTVNISLAASGIELAPAAENRPGTAHHHLYLDTDLGTPDQPIPAGTKGIVHLGKAETSYQWEGVSPGPHRIITILANPAHVPLTPLVADTVNIVVVK